MKILVANIGSTSFKYSLFDMDTEVVLARGRVERIGEALSPCTVESGGTRYSREVCVKDHAVAVRQCLDQLTSLETGILRSVDEISAIGFKAVHAAGISGVQFVDASLLDAMEEFNNLLPAHNPPYIKSMRNISERLPDIPLIAAFETDFHKTIPPRNRYYGVPFEWAERYDVIRYGFHGASHRYISTRVSQIFNRQDLRIISMHLGGSSSLCAINSGRSVAASMGTSPQTGLFHGNRCGDFDPFVIPYLMRKLSKSQEEVLKILATQSGLLGLSGVGADLRDVMNASSKGNERAKLAVETLVGYIRLYLGGYLVELGGADVLVFTGGIGENNVEIREMIVANLDSLGIILDQEKNKQSSGKESSIHAEGSPTQIWIVPTNEEIIVARQCVEKLKENVKSLPSV
ncbi:MAG: acetate/propionate family kinase [Planctomycetaceae bacterium]|jgi:acetate kinase|nr:acetate/propionate family kinase [Planctomycetaceae bacterium]